MKLNISLLLALLFAQYAYASSTRVTEADSLISSDHTKTYSLPSASNTIVGRTSTDTLTNKSIDASTNTLSNISSTSMTSSGVTAGSYSNSNITVDSAGRVTTASSGSGGSGGSNESFAIVNAGLSASVSANALTISLKQSDGSTDPASGSGASSIAYRSATATSGAYSSSIQTTSALSIVIPSGTTIGAISATAENIYVYTINNAGTTELAVSLNAFIDQGGLVSTTAISTGSLRGALYSTTARTNVAVRLIGRVNATEAVAGTWLTSPSTVSVTPFQASKPSWYGYHNGVIGGCSTTNFSGYADVSSCTGITLNSGTNVGPGFGSVVTASGGLPGITFTPPRLGTIYACSTATVTAGGQTYATGQLVDGSGTVIGKGISVFVPTATLSGPSSPIPLCGLYIVTSVSTAITIKIQLNSGNGNSVSIINGNTASTTSSSAITWNLFYVD